MPAGGWTAIPSASTAPVAVYLGLALAVPDADVSVDPERTLIDLMAEALLL